MTRTRRIDWLAYWTDSGFDAQMMNGKLHCRHEEYNTSADVWINCDAWWNGLSEDDLSDSRFPDLYNDYCFERYCDTCNEYAPIETMAEDEHGYPVCDDCVADSCDDCYDKLREHGARDYTTL